MPMGPIELADTVGLDICAAAGKSLARTRRGNEPEAPQVLLNKERCWASSGARPARASTAGRTTSP